MLHPLLLVSGIVPGTSDLLLLSTKGIAPVPLCMLCMLSCPSYANITASGGRMYPLSCTHRQYVCNEASCSNTWAL